MAKKKESKEKKTKKKTEKKTKKKVKKVEGKKKKTKKETDKVMVEDRSVAVPGELLAEGMGFVPSEGAYREGKQVRANLMGLVSVRGRVIKVIPFSGRYIPQGGDEVIGVISDIRHSSWHVDLDSPYLGIISISNAVDRYIDLKKESLSDYLDIGDTILAEVESSTDIAHLTMKGRGLRKLTEGYLVDVPPAKVPRIIGSKGSMVKVIREGTGVNIIVGMNGKVWLKGDRESVKKAIKAVNLVVDEAHTRGLTDKVREMLEIN